LPVQRLKVSFSSVSASQLFELGLKSAHLDLDNVALDERIATSPIDLKYTDALCLQLTRIYCSTSKRFEAGAQMILDAFLLTIADISFDVEEKLFVAILPEMRIAPGDGVLVKNPVNQFEMWLTGNVDDGVCTYKHLILQAPLEMFMRYTRTRIMLVEAKCDKETLYDYMLEATSQAIALSEVTGNKTVWYCLSDGATWVFLAYTSDTQGNRISFVSPELRIARSDEVGEGFKKGVQRLVELLYHWLRTDSDIKNDPLCRFDE